VRRVNSHQTEQGPDEAEDQSGEQPQHRVNAPRISSRSLSKAHGPCECDDSEKHKDVESWVELKLVGSQHLDKNTPVDAKKGVNTSL